MTNTTAAALAARTQTVHRQILDLAGSLDAAQLAWQPHPQAPAVQFHLWHIARWADHMQATLAPQVTGGSFTEIWEREGLAMAWGLSGELGYATTGMGMADDATAGLSLPAGPLRDYAAQAFAAADAVFAACDDPRLATTGIDQHGQERAIVDMLLAHLTHACRHLGMMEAVKGAMGLRGTASV